MTYEFLRPATVAQFIKRLDDTRLPAIDVLHFDGHGAYDTDSALVEQGRQTLLAAGGHALLRNALTAEAQHTRTRPALERTSSRRGGLVRL